MNLSHQKCFVIKSLTLMIIVFLMVFIFIASSTAVISGDKQRSPVPFPHEIHMDNFECTDCHHRYENGENVIEDEELEEGDPGEQIILNLMAFNPDNAETQLSCGNCHNKESEIDLQDAFHEQCIGCHSGIMQYEQNTGPVLCGECHIRNLRFENEEG